jgi:hypothetical protein
MTSANLHPRTFESRKCEHGDCWSRDGRPSTQWIALKYGGAWRLCDEHAAVIRAALCPACGDLHTHGCRS